MKTITIVSNSSELILQTLAEIVPPAFVVRTLPFSTINWYQPSTALSESDCLIVDLTLDYKQFEEKLISLRKINSSCKMIVLNDHSSSAFRGKVEELGVVNTFLNMSDYPEKIEGELKKGKGSADNWIERITGRKWVTT